MSAEQDRGLCWFALRLGDQTSIGDCLLELDGERVRMSTGLKDVFHAIAITHANPQYLERHAVLPSLTASSSIYDVECIKGISGWNARVLINNRQAWSRFEQWAEIAHNRYGGPDRTSAGSDSSLTESLRSAKDQFADFCGR